MDQQLSSITLPSLSAVRDFANLSLVDGLAFMQERSKVIAATSASIERTVARFKDGWQECHPQFKGQIFLLGHSLGGVISWDIIKEKRLSFTPSALFTLGSPLGVFLHTASGVQGKPSMDELGKVRFFNIFHPLDPVAYRMEPLLWPHGPCPPAPAQLNDRDACHAQRVDWALPLAALSSASELLQAVPSHISYYKTLGTTALWRGFSETGSGQVWQSLPTLGSRWRPRRGGSQPAARGRKRKRRRRRALGVDLGGGER
eukprot:g9549.t4